MSDDKIDPSSKDPKISSTADSAKATQGELTEEEYQRIRARLAAGTKIPPKTTTPKTTTP